VNLVRLARVGLKELRSLLLCVALFISLTNSLPAIAEPNLGDPAPGLIITLPNGQPFDLSMLKGRVVLVNFWATWCAPCLAEMSIIEKFYREHHGDGFEVIALSTDSPRVRETVGKVLAGLSFPGALLNDANYNGFGSLVPVSYVIDASGVVRGKFVAGIDELHLNEAAFPLLKEASVSAGARKGGQDAGLSGTTTRIAAKDDGSYLPVAGQSKTETAIKGSPAQDASASREALGATHYRRRRRVRERYASYGNNLMSAPFFFELFQ